MAHRNFGVLLHRGAGQSGVRSRTRTVRVKVDVWREKGASRSNQYCALSYLGQRKRGPRGFARIGKITCASTPTVAVKRALRLFTTKNWTT